MGGRHRRKIDAAPILSAVLAGAFAGAVALAPLDGGSGGTATPVAAKDRQASRQAERGDGGGKASAGDAASDRAEKPDKAEGKSEPGEAADRREDKPAEPPADCDPADAEGDYANGRIPSEKLCEVPGDGESLRADAAMAFYELNKAYHARFGEDMCVRSSYRGYERQKELYASMPAGMAARPGHSKHGLGQALDLCGGVQDGGSPQFRWLEDNSEKYGWIHPAWAYSSPYEPWHWEFTGEKKR